MRVQKIFNGYLRVTNENFLDAYENPNSTEFAELANKVKEAVSLVRGLQLCPCCLLPGLAWETGRTPKSQERGNSKGCGQGAIAALWPALSLLFFFQLKLLYRGIPALGPYHKESAVTAFRWVLGRRLGERSARNGIRVVVYVGQVPLSLQGEEAVRSGPGAPRHQSCSVLHIRYLACLALLSPRRMSG